MIYPLSPYHLRNLLPIVLLSMLCQWALVAMEPVPVYPAHPPATEWSADEPLDVTLILPGIGGRSDRSIALRLRMHQGEVVGRPQIRSWQFQERLQPSHIRRLEREVERADLQLSDGRLRGDLVLHLRGPAQLGNPAVHHVARIAIDLALHPGPAPMLRDDFSTPPWRRVDFPLHGQLLQGIYSGSWQTNEQAPELRYHAAWASLQPLQRPGGPAVSAGDWPSSVSIDADGALHMKADLPHHPVGAEEGASISWRFSEPLSIAGANALRLRWRSVAQPAVQARMTIFDHIGNQWSLPRAMPLLGGEREVIVPLSSFQPDWYTATFDLDTTALRGLGIGLSAAHGPGPLTVELLEVSAIHEPSFVPAEGPVHLSWDPQAIISTDGHDFIQPALFGVHGVGTVPEERLDDVRDLNIGSVRTIEHTNFGSERNSAENRELLHLIEATGSDMAEAMHSYTMGLFDPPPWANDAPAFRERLRAFGHALGQVGYHPELRPDSVRWIEVWNEPFIWGRHINKPYGTIIDPEQPGHLSGPLAAREYAAMYRSLVSAAREQNPHLLFAGPSSSGFAGDDWRHLTQFVLPIIAETHDILDAVAEHHYQGRGRSYAAEWLVADAAIQAIAGRSIPIWNTEANDLSDTPGGWGGSDDRPQRAAERKRAAYQIDEILSHLSFIPHIARGRAIHMLHHGRMLNRGEAMALRFLAPLRGTLIPITSSDPRVLAVAARDGDTIQVVVYNDRHHPLRLAWNDQPPTAHSRLHWSPEKGSAVMAIDDDDDGLTIPPLAAMAYALPAPPALRVVERSLRPGRAADGGASILHNLQPGDSVDLHFHDLPAGSPVALWVVSEGLLPGHGEVHFADGTVIPLPSELDGPRMIRSQDLPPGLDGSHLRVVASAEGTGFRLATLSLVWEHQHSLSDTP